MEIELTKAAIQQAVSSCFHEKTKENNIIKQSTQDLLSLATDGYHLVLWPESQLLMEEEWFDEEAILALGVEDSVGSAAYFVPIVRLMQLPSTEVD
jgi:hypothetical protein